MKIFKKLAGLITALSICLSASVMTASAFTYERLYNKTDEQIEEYLWRQITYVSDYSHSKDSFDISLMYADLKDFLSELEIPDSSYTDEDAYNDFLKWGEKKYQNSTLKDYGDGYIQYDKDNPDEKLYWAYVSNTDEWVCKDEDGKTVRTVDVYHSDNETSSTTTSSKPTEQSSTVSTTSNPGGTVSAEPQPDYPGSTPAMPDSPGSTNTEVSSSPVDEPATESPDSSNTEVSSSPVEAPATDSTVSDSPATEEAVADQTVSAEEVEPNNNNAMQTVLIIIGILIIAGIIVIIVMLNKRKREDNNGK